MTLPPLATWSSALKTRQSQLDLPAKTEYILTYKTLHLNEIWEGTIRMYSTRRTFISYAIFCVIAALTSLSQAFSLLTFMGILIVTALLQFLVVIGCAFLYTVSIVLLSKLITESTITINEDGISDSFGPVKLKYKWHQIHDVEMRKGSIYVIALFNGIQIPPSSIANNDEAEKIFTLAKQYKAAAHQKRNQISAGGASHVQDAEFLLKSLQDEEEAKWLEIENKHKEQNRL